MTFITHFYCISRSKDKTFLSFLYSGGEVSDCGRYVILTIRQGCDPVNKLYYCDLHSMKAGITGDCSVNQTQY